MFREWLNETHRKGGQAYESLAWPALADSPTQQQYTPSKEFDPALFNEKGDLRIEVKAAGGKGVVAKQLGELGDKEFEIFAKKCSTLIPEQEHKLLALKNARLQGGLLVFVPEGIKAEIEVKSSSQNGIVGLHSIVICGKNSKTRFYETQDGGKTLQASATEVFLDEGAQLEFNFTQNLGLDSVDFGVKRAVLQKNARLVWNTAFFGGKTSVCTVDSKLEGEGAHSENYNSYFGRQTQVFDVSTNSFHFAPSTGGNLLSKGVLTGEAQSTYRGLIYISPKGAKTNCFLNGHALLLGKKAKANSLPSLEIHANDVQSRHGATVDHLDEEKVFYLMTRGFPRQQAEKTIVEGFVGEVFDKSSGKALNDWEKILSQRMAESAGEGGADA